MELQNVSIAFISRFHFPYSPHSTDRKWCLFAIQKITKPIFATLTEQFLLADEEFSSEKLKQLSSMELQNVSFAFISRFHFQNPPHSTDRKWCLFAIQKITKAIFLRDTNKTIFASRWRVFFKNPHNSAAWNYRTWELRLSYAFIFIIQLI